MRATQRMLMLAVLSFVGSTAWSQSLRIQGPSAGQAVTGAAVADYQRAKKTGLQVSFGVSGAGEALSKLCHNEIDAVVATRPIVSRELERCRFAEVAFVEVPIAFDAVVVVVNPRNTYITGLSLEMLRTLWSEPSQGKLTRWDQLDPKLPKQPVKLYGPVAQSEGASYFNEAVLGAGQASRKDFVSSVDESILIQAIARDVDGLSYVSLATYLEHRAQLKAVPIAEGAASPVAPTAETVAQGRYRTLSRPLFLYVRVKALENAAIKEFAEHWVANGARIAQQAKLVPLSAVTYRAGAERLRKLAKGSVWEGKIAVGATLKDIERRQAAM